MSRQKRERIRESGDEKRNFDLLIRKTKYFKFPACRFLFVMKKNESLYMYVNVLVSTRLKVNLKGAV